MRKLYALVAGLLFVLVTTKTNSQPSINPQDQFFEISNIAATATVNDEINETCQANFEVSSEASSPLTKKFTEALNYVLCGQSQNWLRTPDSFGKNICHQKLML